MPIVTIRGQLGSGAPDIGKVVASRLNIDYVDREVIADVAAKLNFPEPKIEQQEMPPTSLFARIKEAIAHSVPPTPETRGFNTAAIYLPAADLLLDDDSYLDSLTAVVKELAESKAMVIRGRGSQFILKDYSGVLHVLTVAPLETRIKKVMKNRNLDEKAAKEEIQHFDSSRREFIKRYFKADLEDPINYDLVINTEHLNYNTAASLIINAVEKQKQ